MQIENSFSLIDTAISTMCRTGESKLIINSITNKPEMAFPNIVGAKSDITSEVGFTSRESHIDLDHLPVQMKNMLVAVNKYEANIGVLGRYKQMTETTLELLG
jgi:hypothetical protein